MPYSGVGAGSQLAGGVLQKMLKLYQTFYNLIIGKKYRLLSDLFK